ncbi:DUF3365 domain-containing protein [Halothiobacillus sp. DCM-1]|uniref:Tll0287-like domain-containing protein n=1 Tax=Halothiobacillus sp. DCM-1 TaxID=3112558 RepID=UPI00324864ED
MAVRFVRGLQYAFWRKNFSSHTFKEFGMKTVRAPIAAVVLGMLPLAAFANPSPEAEKATMLRAQEAIKDYAVTLKTALQTAMKAGGPMAAIPVCHTEAPKIAKDVGEKYGLEIHRTSLKPRAMAPTAWEKTVLEQFAAEKAAGKPIGDMVWHQVVEVQGQPTLRVMKAIPTDEVCLTCHGTQVAPAVLEKIRSLYPKDEAIGYEKGDIRGAFSVSAAIRP